MKKNNPNYYSLEFHDKQIKLITELDNTTDFELGDVTKKAANILKDTGGMLKDIMRLSYITAKNIFGRLKKKSTDIKKISDFIEDIRAEKERIDKEFEEREANRGKGKFEKFSIATAELIDEIKNSAKDKDISRSIERHIDSLDETSKSLFRSAGFNQPQIFSLLFSTNPSLVFGEYLKKSKEGDSPGRGGKKSGGTIKKDAAQLIGTSLFDSFESGGNKIIDIKSYCRSKIYNREKIIESQYPVDNRLRNLIITWANNFIGDKSLETLYKKSEGELKGFSNSLKDFARQKDAEGALNFIKKEIKKTNESSNLYSLKFNNKKVILTEAYEKEITVKHSMLFNSIAWIIIESSNITKINEAIAANRDARKIVNYVIKSIKELKEDSNIEEASASNDNRIRITEEDADKELAVIDNKESEEDTDEEVKEDFAFIEQLQREVLKDFAAQKILKESSEEIVEVLYVYTSFDIILRDLLDKSESIDKLSKYLDQFKGGNVNISELNGLKNVMKNQFGISDDVYNETVGVFVKQFQDIIKKKNPALCIQYIISIMGHFKEFTEGVNIEECLKILDTFLKQKGVSNNILQQYFKKNNNLDFFDTIKTNLEDFLKESEENEENEGNDDDK